MNFASTNPDELTRQEDYIRRPPGRTCPVEKFIQSVGENGNGLGAHGFPVPSGPTPSFVRGDGNFPMIWSTWRYCSHGLYVGLQSGAFRDDVQSICTGIITRSSDNVIDTCKEFQAVGILILQSVSGNSTPILGKPAAPTKRLLWHDRGHRRQSERQILFRKEL